MSEAGAELPAMRLGSRSTSAVGTESFGFHAKTKHDASESLIQVRSAKFRRKNTVLDEDIWKKPPPDFRPQIFAPKPPKRNSRESMKPWNYGTIPGQREIIKRPDRTVLPYMLQNHQEKEKDFATLFRIERPFTAKKEFVKSGKNEEGQYIMPKPHDYRQVSSAGKTLLVLYRTNTLL